jgi:3-phosphoshikimate 1-carboxyvinyltransferase
MPTDLRVIPTGLPLRGSFTPPGDRQITLAALCVGALAGGPVLLQGAVEDSHSIALRRVLAHLGVTFTPDDEGWLVVDKPGGKLCAPAGELDCGGSLPALRLLLGLLAGQRFSCSLTGDDGLSRQPLQPLYDILRGLGAELQAPGPAAALPLRIKGKPLRPLSLDLPPADAALKDALLLAALHAVGESRLSCRASTQDHLLRALRHTGIRAASSAAAVTLTGEQLPAGRRFKIPGDFSLAAPLALLAILRPGSELHLNHVGMNPNRLGLLKVLERSGGEVQRERAWQFGSEPVSSLAIRSAGLPHPPRPFNVPANLACSLLEDWPLAALLATQAGGACVLQGAEPLATGTPDRLVLLRQLLCQCGADVEQLDGGLHVGGPTALQAAELQCAGDSQLSRTALAAAALAAGESTLYGFASAELPLYDWLCQAGVLTAG